MSTDDLDIPFDKAPGLPSRRCRLTKARIEPVSTTAFQFTDTHDTGFVVDILAVPGWSGELVELVAWKPEAPARWWLYDCSTPLLGEDLAELSVIVRKEPVRFIATPAEWFEAVKNGAENVGCVIDWSADPRMLMTGLDVRVSSSALARRLKTWWAEHTKPTFNLVLEGARRAA